ncbi:MAG: YidB family protein [Pseudomonadales bacterium]
MDILKMGAELLAQKMGSSGGGSDAIQDAIGKLLGSGDSLDLGSIVSGLQSGGLGNIAASWLGDGENEQISTDQVKDLLGADKVSEAASQLGSDESTLLDSLKDVLPQMIDKSSSGGSLLDSVGGLAGLAKKFL